MRPRKGCTGPCNFSGGADTLYIMCHAGAPGRGPGRLLLALRANSPSRAPRKMASPFQGEAVERSETDEGAHGGDVPNLIPLIRPSVRTGPPSPLWGEGWGGAPRSSRPTQTVRPQKILHSQFLIPHSFCILHSCILHFYLLSQLSTLNSPLSALTSPRISPDRPPFSPSSRRQCRPCRRWGCCGGRR